MNRNFLKYFTFFILPFISFNLSAALQNKWRAIYNDANFSVAVAYDNSLWHWGTNAQGQLANVSEKELITPRKIQLPQAIGEISNVYVGTSRVFIVTETGELWGWGNNSFYSLGVNSNSTTVNTPTRIILPNDLKLTGENTISSITSRDNSTVLLLENGDIYVWGNNEINVFLDDSLVGVVELPTKIVNPFTKVVSKIINGGQTHYYALFSDGTLQAWGDNSYFKLGTGSRDSTIPVPLEVTHPSGIKWLEVVANSSVTYAVDESGDVWHWGQAISEVPTQVKNASNVVLNLNDVHDGSYIKASSVLSTFNKTFAAVSEQKNVYFRGFNNYQQIANSNTVHYSTVFQAKYPDGTAYQAERVNVLNDSIIYLTENRQLVGTGLNDFGQLGFRLNKGPINKNGVMLYPSSGFYWNQAATGDAHTLALRVLESCHKSQDYSGFNPALYNASTCPENNGSDVMIGEIWGWGDNSKNQLSGKISDAEQDTSEIDFAARIGEKSDWVFVEASDNHSFAIDVKGDAYAWGDNTYGQLGITGAEIDSPSQIEVAVRVDPEAPRTVLEVLYISENEIPASSSAPNSVVKAVKWQNISTNEHHTLAIDSEQRLWAWGHKNYGKLGYSTTEAINKPKVVNDTETWKQVAAGKTFSTALSTSDLRYVWGNQEGGRLGNGNDSSTRLNTPQLAEQQPETTYSWDKIVVSDDQTLGVTVSGQIFMWGVNGQVTENQDNGAYQRETALIPTTLFTSSTDNINNELSFLDISAANDTYFALGKSGSLWGWGVGNRAQLADNAYPSFKYIPEVESLDINVKSISNSSLFTIAITEDNELYTWGDDTKEQLGVITSPATQMQVKPSFIKFEDFDGDGTPDYLDPFPENPLYNADFDADGEPDATDTDDDNDGISDSKEINLGLDPLNRNDVNQDLDGDGFTVFTEYTELNTCEFGYDENVYENSENIACSAEMSIPSPMSEGYVVNAIKDDLSLMNRRLFNFESREGQDLVQGFTWMTDTQKGKLKDIVANNTRIGYTAAHKNNATYLTSINETAKALEFSSANRNVTFNYLQDIYNQTYRKLLTGKVYFKLKANRALTNGEKFELKIIPAAEGSNPTGANKVIWSTTTLSTNTEIASVALSVNDIGNGFSQLTWQLTDDCSSDCDLTVWLEMFSFPIDLDEKSIPQEYQKTIEENCSPTELNCGVDGDQDADFDGMLNRDEYLNGSNPSVDDIDTDADGMTNAWEKRNGLNPGDNDANGDADGDGLSNLIEYQIRTNPQNSDTDNDGIPDRWEYDNGLDPLLNDGADDADNDNLSNYEEYLKGTNPHLGDTDGDGIADGSDPVPNGVIVTASAGVNGAISPGYLEVNRGESVAFLITPEPGFKVLSAIGCDGYIGGKYYVAGPVEQSCTIEVTFEESSSLGASRRQNNLIKILGAITQSDP